ncbi:MAG: hypothetical protein QM831_13095 [Kofleriaceae bacterium]
MKHELCWVIAMAACSHPTTTAPAVSDDDEAEEATGEDESDQLPTVTATPTTTPRAALLAEANRELAAMRSSHYEHHTHVDEAAGLFDYDCSGFVGYALARSAPEAWGPIVAMHRRPLAKHFEAFFTAPQGPWTRVTDPSAIVAGDVIAWLEPPEKHSRNTGHIVIVAGPPHARGDELVIPVIDSSHSGHGHADARNREHRNGLGTGELVLHGLDGYRWSTAKHSRLYHTEIAIGHLR